jgi:hypothetical protein
MRWKFRISDRNPNKGGKRVKKALIVSVITALAVSSCATNQQQVYQNGVEQGKKEVTNNLSKMDIHKVYVPAQVVGGAYIPAHYTYKYEKTVVGVNGEGGLQPQTENTTATAVATNTTATAVAGNSTAIATADNGTSAIPVLPNEKVVSVVNTPTPPPPPPNLDNMSDALIKMIDNGDLSDTKTIYETLKKANINTQITNKSQYYTALGKYELVNHEYKKAYDDFAQSYIENKDANIDSKNQTLFDMALCAQALGNKTDEVNAYTYIGDNYITANDKLDALKYYYKANLVDPSNTAVNIKIANILKNMGQDELSKAFLMKAYLQKELNDERK